jgi:hypothetical protein
MFVEGFHPFCKGMATLCNNLIQVSRTSNREHYAFLKIELKTFRVVLLVHPDRVSSPV